MEAASSDRQIVEAVQRAFRDEPRLGQTFHLDRVEMEPDGVLLLEGDVPELAQKKRALLRAAAVPGVANVVDRVHVAAQPARHLRSHVAEALAETAAFARFEVREDIASGAAETDFESVAHALGGADGRIDIEENDGVVTLNGSAPSLVHKRLAGVMAWRVPGVRDVVNGISVEPAEEDGPDQIEEAVRVALDGNPALDATQIKIGVRGHVVRLTGLVSSEDMRKRAEEDAWATLGVDEVIDEIDVAV